MIRVDYSTMHVDLFSFDEHGVEVAETGYALALAYTNVGNEDAESKDCFLFISSSWLYR